MGTYQFSVIFSCLKNSTKSIPDTLIAFQLITVHNRGLGDLYCIGVVHVYMFWLTLQNKLFHIIIQYNFIMIEYIRTTNQIVSFLIEYMD